MQMELVSEPRSHVPPSWQVDTVTMGMLLLPIGGSNVSMGLRPVDTGNAAEWARLAPACDTAKRGILCKLEGPLRFHVTTKRYDAVVVAASGERAEVKLRNTIIECRDLPPAPNPQHTPN